MKTIAGSHIDGGFPLFIFRYPILRFQKLYLDDSTILMHQCPKSCLLHSPLLFDLLSLALFHLSS